MARHRRPRRRWGWAALVVASSFAAGAVDAGGERGQATSGAAMCSEGQVIAPGTRDRCCWPGQRWSQKGQRCAGAPATCPPEHRADGERCVLEPEALGRRIREQVRRGAPALHRCYERALQDGAELRVRSGPRFTIARDGSVTRVVLDPALPPALSACLTAVIRSWRFPPLAGEVEVSYPMNVDAVDQR